MFIVHQLNSFLFFVKSYFTWDFIFLCFEARGSAACIVVCVDRFFLKKIKHTYFFFFFGKGVL